MKNEEHSNSEVRILRESCVLRREAGVRRQASDDRQQAEGVISCCNERGLENSKTKCQVVLYIISIVMKAVRQKIGSWWNNYGYW